MPIAALLAQFIPTILGQIGGTVQQVEQSKNRIAELQAQGMPVRREPGLKPGAGRAPQHEERRIGRKDVAVPDVEVARDGEDPVDREEHGERREAVGEFDLAARVARLRAETGGQSGGLRIDELAVEKREGLWRDAGGEALGAGAGGVAKRRSRSRGLAI